MKITKYTALPLILLSFVLHSASAPEHYRRAMQLYARGDHRSVTDSLLHFKRAIRVNRYYFKALKGLGTAYFDLEFNVLAAQYLGRALRQEPNDPEANLTYARTLIRIGKTGQAKLYIDRVLRQQPRNVLALYTDALYWKNRGRMDLVLSRLRTVKRIQPSYYRLYLMLGDLYNRKKRYGDAERMYRQAIANNANSPVGYYYLGRFFFERGRLSYAGHSLDTALQLSPDMLRALKLQARVLFLTGKWEKARDIYITLTKREPFNHLFRYSLALVYTRLVQRDPAAVSSAVDSFKRALVLKNNDEVIRYAFEEFAVRRLPVKHPQRARLARYHFGHAASYRRSNCMIRARVAIRRAIRLNPVDVGCRRFLASVHRSYGYWEAFYRVLKVLAMLEPDNTHLKDRIDFYKKAVVRLPSRKAGIRQYSIRQSVPKLVIFDNFEQYNAEHGYFGLSTVYGAMLRDALYIRSGVKVLYQKKKRLADSGAARREALRLGADYYVLGRYIKGRVFTVLEIGLYSAVSGERLAKFRSSRRGNRRLFELAVNLADKISSAVPFVARIIRLRGDRVTLNAGRRDGLKKGMLLRVVPGAGFRRAWLSLLGRARVRSTTGMIKINSVDEKVSFGEVVGRKTFDAVATYQYVIPAPKKKKKRKGR